MKKETINYWLCSDTHFNHADRMIELCGRPPDYEEKLFKGLQAIPEKDILIHLGDVCIGKDAEMHAKYIMPLKCKKWLILGNHDRKSNSFYLKNGWDFVAKEIRFRAFGSKLVLRHEPCAVPIDKINIHGHLHNTSHRTHEFPLSNQHLLVAMEYLDYKPIKLDSFLQNHITKTT